MKFGIRDICDVVFKARTNMTIGSQVFKKGQPVLYIDTATVSTLEQATTTVYAQGGHGNARLMAWEGEKTMTFTVTDALISPIGIAILSGAGLFKGDSKNKEVHVHTTATSSVGTDGVVEISGLRKSEKIDATAPVFCVGMEGGDLTGEMFYGGEVAEDGKSITLADAKEGQAVFVDFYVVKDAAKVSEISIDASGFGGNFCVEASTLFRDVDGKDHPAEITLPNVKIRSNFTFNMSATGDPSTFDFVMDAFPEYTIFDDTRKVMCVIQTVDDVEDDDVAEFVPVMLHKDGDSIPAEWCEEDTQNGPRQ